MQRQQMDKLAHGNLRFDKIDDGEAVERAKNSHRNSVAVFYAKSLNFLDKMQLFYYTILCQMR